jgi:hypothetical protein
LACHTVSRGKIILPGPEGCPPRRPASEPGPQHLAFGQGVGRVAPTSAEWVRARRPGRREAFSRRTAPEVCKSAPPQKEEAQGRPGARCTRGLVCNMCIKMRTRAYRFSGNTPAIPAQWLYGLYALSPVTGFLVTVAPWKRLPPKGLTPAPGRQDHTTSPYASAPLVNCAAASTASRSNVSDDGQRPSCGTRRRSVCH